MRREPESGQVRLSERSGRFTMVRAPEVQKELENTRFSLAKGQVNAKSKETPFKNSRA
jgi:hypothetical protein